jgi:hypothetical protein
MYDFIFFFIYSQQIQKGKSELFSRLNGSLIVGVTLVIHIAFVLSVFRKIFFHGDEGYNVGGQTGDIVGKFIVILIFVSAQFYYNIKRAEIILRKHDGSLIAMSTSNIIKVLLLIFAPLIILMRLSIKP